jgi:hypothetical protein
VQGHPNQRHARRIAVDDVAAMLQADISEQTIILKLQKTKQPSDLQPSEMVAFKKAGRLLVRKTSEIL